MAAYIIAELTVHNPERYSDYTKHTPKLVHAHDGKFIVRGGDPKGLEGSEVKPRVVVIEFPDMDTLLGWYNSPEYQAIIPIRQEASDSRLMAVQGAESTPLP